MDRSTNCGFTIHAIGQKELEHTKLCPGIDTDMF